MAIGQKAAQALRSEISQLEKEKAKIDKDLEKLNKSLRSLVSTTGGTKRARKSAPRKKAASKRGRPKSTKLSPRAEKALKVIKANPGITGAELSRKLNLKQPTAVYPVTNRLKDLKKIKKQGKGFKAV